MFKPLVSLENGEVMEMLRPPASRSLLFWAGFEFFLLAVLIQGFLWFNVATSSAQDSAPECFPVEVSWDITPPMLVKMKGVDFLEEKTVPGFIYAYPVSLFEEKGQVTYLFSQKDSKLGGISYDFIPKTTERTQLLFDNLVESLNCLWEITARPLDAENEKAKSQLRIYQNNETYAVLSYLSTQPEVTVQLFNKNDKGNESVIEFWKILELKEKKPLTKQRINSK